MRAGRLPEDHPLEQLARDKLRAKSPAAAVKAEQTAPEQKAPTPKPVQPRRQWGT